MPLVPLFLFLVFVLPIPAFAMKTRAVLYPNHLSEAAIRNAESQEWARQLRDTIVANAKPWRDASNEELWNMPFGHRVTRSWMVLSDGVCPNCGKDVKMYNWKIDIWTHPWKVQCPHCSELFSKNDFAAFHRTGFDERGIFDPAKADRSLLVNPDHPDPGDPLHTFGVDDGEGYVRGEDRWRFIGYYLVAGLWRQGIVGGVRALSEAHWVTGDPVYARKAAILLDRAADLYPDFDFATQGLVYEQKGRAGSVATWHDACEEIRELAQGYDRVFEALPGDSELVAFLSKKATEVKVDHPKATFADIQANIEGRLFRETLTHPDKIYSNFPRTLISLLTLEAILDGPDNRARILELFAEILTKSLKQDGMTGEKGLTGYSAIFPASFAQVMARFDRAMPGLLEDLFRQFPDLYKTYRFHIDTWCGQEFYPLVGDSGSFGIRDRTYRGVYFQGGATTEPSMHQFLWRLHEITKDPVFVQASYSVNGNTTADLPHDLFASDPSGFEKQVQEVIDRVGPEIALSDVNKEEWGLSILRSGKGENRRAVWLNHGVGGGHHHRDGLNVGLFAKSLDLLPDFGYPPVGYGGWGAPKAVWYTMTAAHHTVTVDGKNHKDGRGRTTLWAPGVGFHAVRVAAPEVISGSRFERTVVMVDIDDMDSYIVDILRVKGGSDHAKFVSSFFGDIETSGLNLMPSEEYGHNTETRNFRTDSNPAAGWSAIWTLEDRYGYRVGKPPVHLRYTDLSEGASASLGEAWVIDGQFDGKEVWIPRLMVRRRAGRPPLSSCFVSVLEAFENTPKVRSITRLPVEGGSGEGVALEVMLADGRKDVVIEDADAGEVALRTPLPHGRGSEKHLTLNGELALEREREGKVERVALGNAVEMRFGETEVKLKGQTPYLELLIEGDAANVEAGEKDSVESFVGGGSKIRLME